MKLAIFGGTFDPIHSAHLVVAREAVAAYALDRVLFVPAARPPHKTGSTTAPYEHRYRMVELACAVEEKFEPSRIEEGEARSYSIHTIERLSATLAPADRLFFLIGADAFAEIATWHRWRDVLKKVEFIVVTRPGHRYDEPPDAKVHRLETVALPVSSSEIRQQLAAGATPDHLPAAVLTYIRSNQLYR